MFCLPGHPCQPVPSRSYGGRPMDDHTVQLTRYTDAWDPDDPHANFKAAVAEWTVQDPLETMAGLSAATGIPVGALVRYVLVRWATEGSETLLDLGPRTVERLWAVVAAASAAGTDQARLAAFEQLAQMLSWLRAPLDPPAG
jgi:hypothetical protein